MAAESRNLEPAVWKPQEVASGMYAAAVAAFGGTANAALCAMDPSD